MGGKRLLGRRVLISGGGTGIGKALALHAGDEGASVFVGGRRRDPLAETVAALHATGITAGLATVDLTTPDGPRTLVEESLALLGGLDAVVVNAGFGARHPLEDFPEAEIDEMLAINLVAAIKLTRAALPHLKAAAGDRPGADLLLISSTAGTLGFAEGSVYCATKWGVRGFGKALQEELKPANVRVTIVYPGGTDTAFFDRFVPMVRRDQMLRPEEVARTLVDVLAARPDILFEELTIRPRVVKG